MLYLAPLALRSGELGFPFVTCWFLVIALGILLTEATGLDFERVARPLRVPMHIADLGATFWVAWKLSGIS